MTDKSSASPATLSEDAEKLDNLRSLADSYCRGEDLPRILLENLLERFICLADEKLTSVPSETPRSTIAAPAVAFIEHHKGGDNLTWDPIHHPNAPATPLYRSPVSATPKPFVHGALNCNHAWTGEGAAPASWWCCGVKVYRSYEDYCDD